MTMRPVLTLLLALALPSAAFAEDAVAGKTHILMSSPQNTFWVPLDGSAMQPIYPSYGSGTSVATDGNRFLIANGARAISLYEEGALQPLTTLNLGAEADRSFATWDGHRYLVAWTDQEETVRITSLTRDAALIKTVSLDRVVDVSGLVANGDRILLLEQVALPQSAPTKRRLRAIVLDSELSVRQTIVLGEIPEILAPHHYSFQHLGDAIPFGSGFYVVWHQGLVDWGGGRAEESAVFGTRITAAGAALDVHEWYESDWRFVEGRTLLSGVPEAFDTDLLNAGNHVAALIKRESSSGKAPLTATFVAPNGATLGSRQVAQVELQDDRRSQLEVVRLHDGRTLAVSVVNFAVELIPLNTLPNLPRRRAVR